MTSGFVFEYELLYSDDDPLPVGVTFTSIPFLVSCVGGGLCVSHQDCRERATAAERHRILTEFRRGESVPAKSRRP